MHIRVLVFFKPLNSLIDNKIFAKYNYKNNNLQECACEKFLCDLQRILKNDRAYTLNNICIIKCCIVD